MLETIQALRQEIEAQEPSTPEALEAFRIAYLGRNGKIPALFDEFKKLPPEEKKALGVTINQLKQFAQERFSALQEALNTEKAEAAAHLDLTRTPHAHSFGGHHPLALLQREIEECFRSIGFSVQQGPELEDDWHVFSALNFPPEHPARDMQDTFFVERNPDVLLRTHTSSVQVRVMEQQKPPIRVICPGRVFRNEDISARSHCQFHQIEGLYIDKNVSFADLQQVLLYFVHRVFGAETKIRFRPSYFPFTEPSAEMDISCFLCGGKGCNVCKQTGFLEILGCGMVDPNVLESCGIDSKVYSGYAFGMGIERMAMLKYGIKDIRLFFENDLKFLSQFSQE
jgi:phenylalanyl-tRNA synthetase, alpha subunit